MARTRFSDAPEDLISSLPQRRVATSRPGEIAASTRLQMAPRLHPREVYGRVAEVDCRNGAIEVVGNDCALKSRL